MKTPLSTIERHVEESCNLHGTRPQAILSVTISIKTSAFSVGGNVQVTTSEQEQLTAALLHACRGVLKLSDYQLQTEEDV